MTLTRTDSIVFDCIVNMILDGSSIGRITAYKIAKNTGLNISSVYNVLKKYNKGGL